MAQKKEIRGTVSRSAATMRTPVDNSLLSTALSFAPGGGLCQRYRKGSVISSPLKCR